MDFFLIKEREGKRGVIEIYPDFSVERPKDLMIQGQKFFAVWDPDKELWSKDEYNVARLTDRELYNYASEQKEKFPYNTYKVCSMKNYSSKSWSRYKQFVRDSPDSFELLDSKITFSNTKVKRDDYVSKKLPYALEKGDISAYEELISTLYAPEEREKLEWAIGSIIAGESVNLQKFIVLYGSAGTGKSTVLNIIQEMFDGYYTVFDAKELASKNNSFATGAFKDNPLVAIQHDGDLSKIEDNSKINSIVSHEQIMINDKYRVPYPARCNCFLFMGTNQPVKITDAKSGIIRRLIDVSPTGEKVKHSRYSELFNQISFELGAIAYHCLKVYEKLGPYRYDTYRPLGMMFKTDIFYNFVESCYDIFEQYDGVSLKSAWTMYKDYCEESLISQKMSKIAFREELKNYFKYYHDEKMVDGKRFRNYYSGFKKSVFKKEKALTADVCSLIFNRVVSRFDSEYENCPAQYGKDSDGTPRAKWENCKTKLKDLDTSKLHYVMVPKNHIVIDFDIKNPDGTKSLEKNLIAASKFPPTYGELSKSGCGVHLHYIYDGDVTKLNPVYDKDIEVKVFTGNSSLRRKLTFCNDIPIATISSGLPIREEKPVINVESVKSEKALRKLIERNLNKEIHSFTRPSIDFIHKILEDAYNSGLHYDVSDMYNRILIFAEGSTHQAAYCVNKVGEMKFHSDEPSVGDLYADTSTILFYDVEVFSNLFVVVYKAAGKKPIKMINPTPNDIAELVQFRLIGFNCRRYDNHILYARLLGYSNEQLYNISQRIISGDTTAFFGEAYGLSYTDIYDFCSTKQSLKKWEIALGIHHQELGLKWDEPVPEDLWKKVADYCVNDVEATEAVWNANQSDFAAREILAELAGMTVNDTTNQLTTRIIFGKEKKPQNKFMYRDLSQPVKELPQDVIDFLRNEVGLPIPFDDKSLLPYFPGYKFEFGKSTYRGRETGEGGYVYSEPSMTGNVGLFDISSMHPSSVIDECLFGVEYTRKFKMLLDIRIGIKHKEYDKVAKMFDGKLAKYLGDEKSSKSLSKALKIAINSVYGLTSAKFDNPFRDPRNVDNIVAKRGALFMINLEDEVKSIGKQVLHIKTDSIKIPDSSNYIWNFVKDYGKQYGYNFEYEHNYNKICLVNKAVYIARYSDDTNIDGEDAGKWTATGAQFQHPYVFKKLFSHEPITFEDMCETRNVSTALYLDMNENLPDMSSYEAEIEKLNKQIKDPKSKLNKILDPGEREKETNEIKERILNLEELVKSGHNYIFVGKTGLFCPMKNGCGAGVLVREKNNGKFDSAPNSSGTRWMEAEMVKTLGKENDINEEYFEKLCDEAIHDISELGDFNWFVSEDRYVTNDKDKLPIEMLDDWAGINSDELPF